MEFCRLINENIFYISKTLQHCEELCCKENILLKDLNFDNNIDLFKNVIKQLNYAINVCLHCNPMNDGDVVKYDIFYYLISSYYGKKYSVVSPVCSFDIIQHLMITNAFKGFIKVIIIYTYLPKLVVKKYFFIR